MRRPDAKIPLLTATPGSYTRPQVRRLLSITERQLRQWETHALIPAAETFSLSDLVALRTLRELHKQKVSASKVRQAVTALRKRLAHVEDPLREVRVIAEGRKIRVEMGAEHMEPVSGQLLFNFDAQELKRLLAFPGGKQKQDEERRRRETAEFLFQKGLSLEQGGDTIGAMKAYEEAVNCDSMCAGALVNLGTLCFNSRQFRRAEEYYKRAVEVDNNYALAHFNLGNLYDERGDYENALRHYTEAVALQPGYADAHYNLALLHQAGGQVMEAVRHWKIYLRLDPGSAWGAIARRELDKLRRSAVIQNPKQRA